MSKQVNKRKRRKSAQPKDQSLAYQKLEVKVVGPADYENKEGYVVNPMNVPSAIVVEQPGHTHTLAHAFKVPRNLV